ncbi:MAG: heme o synthase [Acidobacteria bacterium]|nr:heme o synthase [Acidobacteriota bacterium]
MTALTLGRVALRDWVQLTKPRITAMVLFTTLVGFVTASVGPVPLPALLVSLLGTGLVASGAAVLNQVLERGTDALMLRTRDRPLPAGRVSAADASVFGGALSALGLAVLMWGARPLAAAVAAVTLVSYLAVYTPLKRRTPLSTLVGAVPGALPPVIGWAAARGSLDGAAFVLFAILFLWQIPHFLAIAWLYRDDYARAGFPMLPVVDREGGFTARQTVVHSLALLLVSMAAAAAGLGGAWYLGGAFVLGVALTLFAVRLVSARDLAAARGLFLASVLYLPALCSLLLAARFQDVTR